MKALKISIFSCVVALMASCTTAKTYSVMARSNTNTAGTAKFSEMNGRVMMMLNVRNLTPGSHGVHIHEFGDCSAPNAESAGGHWNPAMDMHGKHDMAHYHMGDINNLMADANGNATLNFSTDKWCLGCSDASKNIMGKSIVIHAGADDFQSQPSGNSGGRVGCIEIK